MDINNITNIIKEHGWVVINTETQFGYPYSYSVGLWDVNSPDVIVIGMSAEKSKLIIDKCCELILENLIDVRKKYKIELDNETMFVRFIKANNEHVNRFMCSNDYYGKKFDVLQVLWPDEYGHYPTYKNFKGSQFLMSS